MQLKKILNPTMLFLVITLIAVKVFYDMKVNNNIIDSTRIINYIIMPFLIYIFFTRFLKRYNIEKKKDKQFKINNGLLILNSLLLYIYILISGIVLIKYIFVFGGISGFISGVINGRGAYELQVNLDGILAIAYQFNVMLPCNIMLILTSEKRKKYKSIIILSIILNLFYSILISARVLFITNIISIVFYIFYDKKIKTKMIVRIVIIVFIAFQFMLWGQMRTSNVGDKKEANQILKNYFVKSLENGYTIIDNNMVLSDENGPYWTVRPLLNLPIITKFLNIDKVYEKYIGFIPVKSRMDDFKYAENIGINPQYNTLSIYGYSYIDYGNYGVLFISITYLIVWLFYCKSDKNKYFRIIFIIMIVSCFDILRTNGIYSPIIILRIIIIMIFYLFEKFTNKYKVRLK